MAAFVPREDIARQYGFMDKLRELNAPNPRTAWVETYGCQQNEADSQRLRGMLLRSGYLPAESRETAEVIVLNTCSVRDHAEQRIFGLLGALTHLKKARPQVLLALGGCMAQRPGAAERVERSYRHVDLVFGPQSLWRFPELLYAALTGGKRVFAAEDVPGAVAEGLPTEREQGVRAWLSVIYGCNNFCAYCIVPYVRGRERSRRREDVRREAQALIAAGAKDITLLGQNVNSYGRDLEEATDFPALLRELADLPGEFLLRFMTSHPKDAGPALFDAMAQSEKIARHLHLPFQSGSNAVLRAMNRRYTRESYLELVQAARERMDDLVLTSDVIVGFPGETERDFLDTLDLMDRVGFDALFTFVYSPRPGTPAAELSDDTPREEKDRRFAELLRRQNAISAEKHRAYVGRALTVLIDGESGDEEYPLSARTNGGRLVRLRGPAAAEGFVQARITGSNTWALYGETV